MFSLFRDLANHPGAIPGVLLIFVFLAAIDFWLSAEMKAFEVTGTTATTGLFTRYKRLNETGKRLWWARLAIWVVGGIVISVLIQSSQDCQLTPGGPPSAVACQG